MLTSRILTFGVVRELTITGRNKQNKSLYRLLKKYLYFGGGFIISNPTLFVKP